MAIAIQWLVRNFELWATIAGIVQVAGKPPFLKVLADIEDKKHSLINTVVGEMVPSICTENNQIIATPLQQMLMCDKVTPQYDRQPPLLFRTKGHSIRRVHDFMLYLKY